MQEWLMTITLGIIGVFLIAVTYAALYQSKKSQKHISGFPFFGGFILAVAFLFSPIKWLAFLGFIDYGLWLLPYVLIMDYYNNKKFKKIYVQQNFEQRISDESKELRIRIYERNEEWVQPYITNLVYELKVPKLLYAVCTDQNGKKFLLIDKCKRKGNIEIVPFDNNTILLTDLNSKNVDYSVEIEIKDKIGVVFDENHFPDIFTPNEIGTYMSGIYSKWERNTYVNYLSKFELPADKRVKDFSKGMKVKLAFAVALSHKAELLILDEATSGLDPIIRDDILDILIDFVQDENHSVLVSSHIISDLEKVADYITFIHKGKLVFTHSKDELVDNYGVMSCGAVVFDNLDKSEIIAYRKEDYQYKVLVKDRHIAEKKYPKAIVVPAAIEEIMLFYVKGGK